MLNTLRANHIYYPNTIKIPNNEKGNLSFKLDQLAPFNGIKDFNAHDALGDAAATIKLAEIIHLLSFLQLFPFYSLDKNQIQHWCL